MSGGESLSPSRMPSFRKRQSVANVRSACVPDALQSEQVAVVSWIAWLIVSNELTIDDRRKVDEADRVTRMGLGINGRGTRASRSANSAALAIDRYVRNGTSVTGRGVLSLLLLVSSESRPVAEIVRRGSKSSLAHSSSVAVVE